MRSLRKFRVDLYRRTPPFGDLLHEQAGLLRVWSVFFNFQHILHLQYIHAPTGVTDDRLIAPNTPQLLVENRSRFSEDILRRFIREVKASLPVQQRQPHQQLEAFHRKLAAGLRTDSALGHRPRSHSIDESVCTM